VLIVVLFSLAVLGTVLISPWTSSTPAGATASASSAVCSPHRLDISLTNGVNGAGHFSLVILVRNGGSTGCRLSGYPEVGLLNAEHSPAAQASETPTGFTGGLPAGAPIPVIHLGPGEVAAAVLEGTDVPTGGAATCPSYPSLRISLPGLSRTVTFARGFEDCSEIAVHPFVIGFNGSFPSGEVTGLAPACKAAADDSTLGPFVQIRAMSGASVAGMNEVAASAEAKEPFQMILKPGRYRIVSEHDPSSVRVNVQAGRVLTLGTYGSCYRVTTTPTTSHGGAAEPTTSTTT
jgi:hypothetical protein